MGARMELKEKELGTLQTENAKQYMEWVEAHESSRLFGLKYGELKVQVHKLQEEKQKLGMRHRDLQNLVNEEQTESCKTINKLNEAIAQLEFKGQQLEKKIGYMNIEFVSKVNEVKYWKGECEKQKKWAEEFKRMQEQFLEGQRRERIEGLSRASRSVANSANGGEGIKGGKKVEVNSIAAWELE
jgi:hypothetical protein